MAKPISPAALDELNNCLGWAEANLNSCLSDFEGEPAGEYGCYQVHDQKVLDCVKKAQAARIMAVSNGIRPGAPKHPPTKQ